MPEGVGYASTNVVAGAGLDLNYVQDRCFAYSGLFEAKTQEQTLLDFATGSDVIVGKFTFNGLTRIASASDGGITAWQVQFNGIPVSQTKSDTGGGPDSPGQTFQEVIIPPYTSVKAICISSEDTANEHTCITFTGKTI